MVDLAQGPNEGSGRQQRVGHLPQNVIDAMPDMMVVIDLDYHVVQANRAARDAVAGVDPAAGCLLCYEVLQGRTLPCEGPQQVCPLKQVIATKAPVATTHMHYDAQGHEVFLDVRASPVFDEVGQVTHVVELCRDVTERKRAERALRLTQFSVDHAGDAVFWVTRDAHLVYANLRACRHLGYSFEEILGLTVHDVDPYFPAETWPKHWEELKQRGSFTFESQHRAKHGKLIPVEITVNYLEFEGQEYNCAIVRDITERKQVEESLRESEERFRTVVSASSDAIIAIGPDGLIAVFNPAAEQMFGHQRSEMLGQPVDRLMPEEFRRRHRRARESYFAAGTPRGFIGKTVELPALRGDGQVFPVELSLSEGRLGGKRFVLAVIRDITQRKRAEEEIRQAQQRLLERQRHEKELVEAELSKARETLVRQTRLAAVGQLSASIAHELRNPLGAISNAVFLLRQRIPPGESKCQQYADVIGHQLQAAGQIIADCVAISRGRPASKSPVALGSILAQARSQLPVPEAIQWHFCLQPEPFGICGDASQLEQLFKNLFLNAVQALGSAGTIAVEARHSGQYDEIRVSDSGPGIPEGSRDQVFEPLVTTKAHGTGLGLTICRQIVEQHGGTIEVLSGDSPGAIFQIRLPAGEA